MGERFGGRTRFQCAARGCDGCLVCDPETRHPAPREDVEALIRAADLLYPTAIEEWKALREAVARVKAHGE